MTRPFFSKERITDFENFDRHATAAIALAKDRLRAGFPIDFQASSNFARGQIHEVNSSL